MKGGTSSSGQPWPRPWPSEITCSDSDCFHQAALPRGRRGRVQDSPAGVRAGQAPAWRSHAVLAISSGRRYRSGAASGKKPEMFSRPEIKMNSSAEDWADFEVEWEQCKEEYTLAGSALIRQLYSSCSDKLKQSLSRSAGHVQSPRSTGRCRVKKRRSLTCSISSIK